MAIFITKKAIPKSFFFFSFSKQKQKKSKCKGNSVHYLTKMTTDF